jgi:hypothetical protein
VERRTPRRAYEYATAFNRPATNLQPPSLRLNTPAGPRRTAQCRPGPPLRSGVRQGSLANSALPDSGQEHRAHPGSAEIGVPSAGRMELGIRAAREKDEYDMIGYTLDSSPSDPAGTNKPRPDPVSARGFDGHPPPVSAPCRPGDPLVVAFGASAARPAGIRLGLCLEILLGMAAEPVVQ